MCHALNGAIKVVADGFNSLRKILQDQFSLHGGKDRLERCKIVTHATTNIDNQRGVITVVSTLDKFLLNRVERKP